jgi:predicted nuclease of predicted toxin-antitoxin system
VTLFAALYSDEDMSALVATLLRSRGLDVTTVPEQGTLGKTDREQLDFATSVSRCIGLTQLAQTMGGTGLHNRRI